jgi:hypothetical protein
MLEGLSGGRRVAGAKGRSPHFEQVVRQCRHGQIIAPSPSWPTDGPPS